MNIIPKPKKEKNLKGQVVLGADYAKSIRYEQNDSLADEAYILKVKENEIVITASTVRGQIWGRKTLEQLIMEGKAPLCTIEDEPKYSYRGFHIDCARHFHSIEELKKIILEASRVKMNYFHWHLSDDQGWRVEIEKYPKLYSQCNKEYYSKAEIKDLVAFAEENGVTIIPEIDMPGHTRAMTAAYPFLSCSEERVELATCGGIFPVILCPGKETTFEFVQNVIDEMVPFFKGEYFHLGSDEAPKHEWKKCPACQKRMKELGLKSEWELQGYFTRRIADYAKEKYGKKIILWNDSLETEKSLSDDEIVQYWSLEHREALPDFLNRGGHFIYSDMFDLYYDYPAAMSPMKRSYLASPMIDGHDYSDDEVLLGFECCTWSEYIDNPTTLENRMFPRLYALAENAWSGGIESNYEDFCIRLKTLMIGSNIKCGNGDPKGLKKMVEKLGYAKTMSTGMPKEVRQMTVDAAAPSEEFMNLFKEKMLK